MTLSTLLTGLMNTDEAAEYLGVSAVTLKRWRGKGSGPVCIQLGPRTIRYRQTDLDSWIISRRMNGKKKI